MKVRRVLGCCLVVAGFMGATASVTPTAAAAGATLWAAAATQKVLPFDGAEAANLIWSSRLERVTLAVARNESEGFHLVVRAGDSALEITEIRVSDLVGAAGTIASQQVSCFRQAWFEVPAPSDVWGHPRAGRAGTTPDALIPLLDPYGSQAQVGIPFVVPANSNQPLWVSIEVPAATQPGSYEGTLAVVGDSTLATITVRLQVWEFVLPDQPTLATYFNLSAESITELYQVASRSHLETLVHNHYRELARRRIGAGYAFFELPEYSNDEGFDWSGAEAFWRRWLDDEHMPVAGAVPIYRDGQYTIQRPNGSPHVTADLSPGSQFETQARLFFERLWDDLDDRGWSDRIVVFMEDDSEAVSDEPYNVGRDAYDRVRAWASIVRTPDPDQPNKGLPLLVAGDSIIPSAPYADLRGSCDIWDMYMDEIDANSDQYAARLAAAPGEQLWVVPNAYGDFIDYPAIYPRSVGWFAFKHGASGIEQWDMLAWFNANEEVVDPWQTDNLTPVWGWGAGALLWPGANIEGRGVDIDGPLSSLRLELQRQGLEDAEYLALLEEMALADSALALALGVLPTALYDGLGTTSDCIERTRHQAAELISGGGSLALVSGTVRTTTGTPLAGAVVRCEPFAALSGPDGGYELPVTAGRVTLNAVEPDHQPHATNLRIAAGQSRSGVDLVLDPLAFSEAVLFGSFESAADLWEIGEGATIQRSSAHTSHGSWSMRARFDESAEDPLIATEEIEPAGWTGYDFLELDVFNASDYLTLVEFAIADASYSYSGEIYWLRPAEWTTLRLPMERLNIDLGEIVEVGIYVDAAGKGDRELYFDRFRLVRMTGADTSAPAAPAGLSATSTLDGVELTWSAPDTDAGGGRLTGLAGFQLYRRADHGGASQLVNASFEIVAPRVVDTEAEPGTTYLYSVRGVDQAGNSGPASAEVRVDFEPGSRPQPRRPSGRVRPAIKAQIPYASSCGARSTNLMRSSGHSE